MLGLGLAATAGGSWLLWSSEADDEKSRFEAEVAETHETIEAHLQTYLAVLVSGAGFFSAERASGEDIVAELPSFSTFARRLDLEKNYRGLYGIGFSKVLRPGELEQMEARMRAGPRPSFRVWPPPTGDRDLVTTILAIEPRTKRNDFALGFDMASEDTRREAMTRARDTGMPALSGRVTLVQEIEPEKQHGFLIYVPVYEGGALPDTVEERRQTLVGFAYGAFRAGNAFGDADDTHGLVAFRVDDGPTADPSRMIYESPGMDHDVWSTRNIELAGHVWTVSDQPSPDMRAALAARTPWPLWFSIAGVVASLSAFAFSLGQLRSRTALHLEKERAEEAADLRERLLAMVGHDLRNPLGAISMAAQLMLRRDQLDVDDRRAAQRIVDSAGRMGRLIGKLMDYAQIRRGGELTMNFAPADIHAATRTAVDELTLARPDREIFVDTRGAGDGVWDADRITEVVSNLVGNALQHGDGPVHVVVHDAERGGGTA